MQEDTIIIVRYYYSQHLTTGGEKNIIGNLMMLYNMWQWKKRKVILELVL